MQINTDWEFNKATALAYWWRLKSTLAVILGVFFVSLIGAVWYGYNNPVLYESQSVKEGMVEGEKLEGYLYFSAIDIQDKYSDTNVFAYDFATGRISAVTNSGSYYDFSIFTLNGIKGALFNTFGPNTNQEGENEIVPALMDMETGEFRYLNVTAGWHETALTFNSNLFFIAFARQPEFYSQRDESGDISTWEVIIHSPAVGRELQIKKAFYPVWDPNSDDIFYLRKDGIYRYDIKKRAEQIVYEAPEELNANSELTASKDGRLWLTLPSGGYEVLKIARDTTDVVYKEATPSDGRYYMSAVLSPQESFYAITKRDKVFQAGSRTIIEFRDAKSHNIIETLEPDGFAPNSLYLEDWSLLEATVNF